MGTLDFFRRENLISKIAIFTGLLVSWVLIYVILFIPLFNKYIINHAATFNPIMGFIIDLSFIVVSLFILSWLIDGLELALNMTLGLGLSFLGLGILTAPSCISPDGTFLVTASNMTCYMGMDLFFATILKSWLHITGNLYYYTYLIAGTILLWLGSIKILLTLRRKGIGYKDEKK